MSYPTSTHQQTHNKSVHHDEKDQLLNTLKSDLEQLRDKSGQIGNNLDIQNKLLEQTTTDVEQNNAHIGVIQQKLSGVLELSKRWCWPYLTIGALVICSIILLLIIIYG